MSYFKHYRHLFTQTYYSVELRKKIYSPVRCCKVLVQVGNERMRVENTSSWRHRSSEISLFLHLCEVLDSIIASSAKEKGQKYLRM